MRATTDLGGALTAVREAASQAASDGVQLLVFPEATLGGYPRGASFGTVVGDRSREGRDEFLSYSGRSVEVPGPEVDELAAVASEHGLHLVVGVIERVVSTLHCAVVMFDDSGRLIGVRHIAVEGRCFVLAANQFAQARDLAPEYATAYTDPDEVVCRGASVIVDPFGAVLAGPLMTGSGLLCADIDLDDVVRGRLDFDAAGHYARPDIFTLVVDDRPKPTVSWMSHDAGDAP